VRPWEISEIVLTCHLTQLAGLNQLPLSNSLDAFLEMCRRPLACYSDHHISGLTSRTICDKYQLYFTTIRALCFQELNLLLRTHCTPRRQRLSQ